MTYELSTPERNLIGRRQALCTLAGITTAVAGIALVGVGTARAATPVGEQPELETVTAQEVTEQVEVDAAAAHELALVEALIPPDLHVGEWSIEQVKAPQLGSIPVVMRSPGGEAFQVDVLRRDANMQGVADTRYFSLFIANGGNGSKTSDELQARGAKVLGYHIARTELSGAPRPKLMSFSERSNRYPLGNFDVMG